MSISQITDSIKDLILSKTESFFQDVYFVFYSIDENNDFHISFSNSNNQEIEKNEENESMFNLIKTEFVSNAEVFEIKNGVIIIRENE